MSHIYYFISARENSKYSADGGQTRAYKDFVHHFPYVGLIACLFCSVGGILYSVETNVLQNNIVMAYQQVCHTPYEYPLVGNILIICKALGGLIVALSFLIFFASVALRLANFKESMHPSRTPSMVFLLLIYPAFPIWTILLGALIIRLTKYKPLTMGI